MSGNTLPSAGRLLITPAFHPTHGFTLQIQLAERQQHRLDLEDARARPSTSFASRHCSATVCGVSYVGKT
jgi:hypothetical protein